MNKFIALIFTLLFSTLCAAEPYLSIQTQIGTIELASADELNEKIAEINATDSSADETTQKRLALYKAAIADLAKIDELNKEKDKTTNAINRSSKLLQNLSQEYTHLQQQKSLSDDSFKDLSENEINEKLNEIQINLSSVQVEVATASNYVNHLRTLPEKAQNLISNNNLFVKELLERITASGDPDIFLNKARAVLIYRRNLENTFYKECLGNLSVLQDLTNYKFKIATLKFADLENQIKILNKKKNDLILEEGNNDDFEKLAKLNPALEKIVRSINNIKSYTLEHKQKNSSYEHDLQVAESALTKVTQIKNDLDNQIKELGKNLVLSRLLNKQLTFIPEVNLSYDLNEEIANLNIYVYEIREQIDKLTDVEVLANNEIKLDRKLSDYKNELVSLYSQRRRALNDLYQVMTNEMTTIIELKSKYVEYQSIKQKIISDISEQLFWIKSNIGLSQDFFSLLIPSVKYEFSNLIRKVHSEKFQEHTLNTLIFIVLPFMFLSLIVLAIYQKIKNNNDALALRLDRPNDTIFVTPMAILNNIILMTPSLCWMICIGAVIICASLATTSKQMQLILTMVLHIFVFTFFLQIIKPNALVQRHFSVPPYQLAKYRPLLKKVWVFALPLLIFANVAETDSNFIYADVTSYLIVLLSFVALLFISIRMLIGNLKNLTNSTATTIILCLLSIIICFMGVMFVSAGYLYTIVKLTNRVAYTCYIILAYFLVSQTLHRMIYVYVTRIFSSKDERAQQTGLSAAILTQLNIKPSFLIAKIYKFSNTALIVLTLFFMYMQWNDLASVLRYLDTIRLWSNSSFVNGQMVVTDYLSVANVLFAVLILLFTGVLNRNVPPILEKMFLIKKGVNNKSTSYTVKVISSYLIIGLGIIFASGALGIKWENLQWLVAALSVGLGFGLQEIFANFVSGIILLFERQLRVGDIITLDSLSGTVSKIRIRSTTVLSFENKEVMIPNRSFITSALTNWSLSSTVTKLTFSVGIAYGNDVDKAKSLLRGIVNRCKYISRDHNSQVYVQSLDDSAVTIGVDVYVSAIGDRKLTTDYLCRETLSSFAQNNIEIPFNQVDVNLKTLEKDEFIEKLKNGLFSESEKGVSAKA